MCRQIFLHHVISSCATKKNIQTVKVSLLTCLKIRGHELPASALSLIFPLHRDRSAATRSAVICSVIVRSDWDFFTMFHCAALSQWTFTDPYQICRSAELSEISPALMLHKCAGYIFQLIRCTQDWCRYKSGDGATKHLSQGYFHQCILGLQILVCFTSNFPSLPAQNHTHGRAVLQAEWASIMWSPRCINSSSRRRLSHLITLNQTNVDERWRERGEGGGRWWRGGLEGSARDELTVNV